MTDIGKVVSLIEMLSNNVTVLVNLFKLQCVTVADKKSKKVK